ncbi:hypothetical protein [Nostoc sp. FACHB-888]|uniref:hypothetical protein n=1 Tax=Nostoc sp. FACHB-888 TaxID=2692842 RepID=UPI00168375F0|nr:hypothetical protein [Nostoc sp. FACHB-888]MBD2247243.1 hypothetical protein [Nostoc sp. FACHB-888]
MRINAEQIPTEYFIFCDFDNQFKRQNLRLEGGISSIVYASAYTDPNFKDRYLKDEINYLSFLSNPAGAGFLSFYCVSAISDPHVDSDAEKIRSLFFKQLPSRLSALYAFATQEDCIKAHELYKWNLNSVRKFTLLKDSLTRVARVNMEIVSLMRFAYRKKTWSSEDIERIWRHYWAGEGNLEIEVPTMQPPPNNYERRSSGEVWEYLIEGRLELQGDLDTPIQF